MSAPVSMAVLLRAVFADLVTWSENAGGHAYLSQNPQRLLELIAQGPPASFRCILHWQGITPAGGDAAPVRGDVDDHRLAVLVDGKLGLTAQPSESLVQVTPSREVPFLETVEAVRNRILAYRTPWLGPRNNRMRDLGIDDNVPMADGSFVACYVCKFGLFAPRATVIEEVQLLQS